MSHEDKVRKQSDKLDKKEKKYLNSSGRVMQRLIIGIVEYILMFLLMMVVAYYMENHTLENFHLDFTMFKDYLAPGGMLFNALIGYLPIIGISCIGVYFGEGTVGKMVVGVAKCIAIIVWLVLIFQGASTSLAMPDSISNLGLDDLTIGLEGLIKFAVLLFACAILIPIGEFAGARKKHKRALEHKKALREAE
ncbi:MAG: hypothetical protein MJZ21_01695 [archaeon]|nr:hypothetical protein [archaeon]